MSDKAIKIARKLEEEHTRQLPLKFTPSWSEDKRAMSKNLARTALFTVRKKGAPRERYDKTLLASMEGIELRYSGWQLDQDDHSVFMQLCHLARDENIGDEVHITGAQALNGLRWSDSEEDYARLRSCYERLLEGTVWLTVSSSVKRAFMKLHGSHLFSSVDADTANSADIDSTATRWTIKLNPDLANILCGNETTLIKWAAEKKLSPLANWLHRFFATHDTTEEPAVFKAETLHRLCGSRQMNMATWRQALKRALVEVEEVGFFKSQSMGPRPSWNVTVVNKTLKEIDVDPRWKRDIHRIGA